MNIYLATLLLIAGALGQSVLAPYITLMGVKPDILLLLVISWSIIQGAMEGVIWGFIGGLALDLLSGGPLGVSALILVIIGLLTNLGESNLLKSNIVLPLLAGFIASCVYESMQMLALQAFGWNLSLEEAITRVILPTSLLNTVLMPGVYLPLQALSRAMQREKELKWQ